MANIDKWESANECPVCGNLYDSARGALPANCPGCKHNRVIAIREDYAKRFADFGDDVVDGIRNHGTYTLIEDDVRLEIQVTEIGGEFAPKVTVGFPSYGSRPVAFVATFAAHLSQMVESAQMAARILGIEAK